MAHEPYYDEIVTQIVNAMANHKRMAKIAIISHGNTVECEQLLSDLTSNGTIDNNEWKIFVSNYVDTVEECCRVFNYHKNIIVISNVEDKGSMDMLKEMGRLNYHIIDVNGQCLY
jgi:hypothetical protein